MLVLTLVWFHSLVPEQQSFYESAWVTNSIIQPLVRFFGSSGIEKEIVRKLAHVAEFGIFTLLCSLAFRGKPVKSFYSGFSAAFLDETIQLLSKRGALIADVWIDLIGVTIGTGIGWLITRMNDRKKKRINAGEKEENGDS